MKNIKILFLSAIALFSQSCLPADEDPVSVEPISGAVLSPDVSGESAGFKTGTEPNQVWVSLSDASMSTNKRTDWDFAFYSGDEYRVLINYSIMMGAAKIPNATNIDAVKKADVSALMDKIIVMPQDPSTEQYIDDPTGNFLKQNSAIGEVKENDADNAIYLVNMGKDIYDGSVLPGGVISGGNSRGWKKIQVVRNGTNGYKIKYADVDATSHQEFIITKDEEHNFSFFSVSSGKIVNIQPKKKNWDMVFTVFTNHAYDTSGVYQGGTYIYNDFVLTNIVDGVGSYQVTIPSGQNQDLAYKNFKSKDIDVTKFIFNDQRAIGDHWRTVTGNNGAQVYGDRFFIVKNANGFFFKLRFNKMLNDKGDRGYPQFEYEPL